VRELLAQGAKAFARSIDGEGLALRAAKQQHANNQTPTGEISQTFQEDHHQQLKATGARTIGDGIGENESINLLRNASLNFDSTTLLGGRHHSAPSSPLSWAQHAEGMLARAAAYSTFLQSTFPQSNFPAVQMYNSALAAAAAAAAAGIPTISSQPGLNFLANAAGAGGLGHFSDAASIYGGVRLANLTGVNGSSAFLPSVLPTPQSMMAGTATAGLKRNRTDSPLTISGDGGGGVPPAKTSRAE